MISEEVAKTIGLEIKPYDKTKVKATANEKVKDILGFTVVDVILGDQKMEKVEMLVFKNATNPCLIVRNVLATHPRKKNGVFCRLTAFKRHFDF